MSYQRGSARALSREHRIHARKAGKHARSRATLAADLSEQERGAAACVGLPFVALGRTTGRTPIKRTRRMTLPVTRWAPSIGTLLLAIAVSHPAAAQAPALATPATSVTASMRGSSLVPLLAATRFGFSADDAQPQTVNASAGRMGKRGGRALALVGAAAVIAAS